LIRSSVTIGAAVATTLVVLAGACWLRPANGAMPDDAAAHEHMETSAGDASAHAAGYDTDQATLTVRPEAPRAGQPALLIFTLTDASGQPIEDLMTHHGRKLHVLIVSEDMQVFGHVHPRDFDESIEHGVAKVSFPFPQAGRYVVAGDFMSGRGSHTARFIVDVTGVEPTGAPDGAAAPPGVRVVEIEAEDRYTRPIFLRGAESTDGYTVSLQKPDEVRAGEPVSLVYRFSRDATPVTDLRPYLAAPLHLAIVKNDLTQFMHEHGTAAVPGHSGHSGHGDHESQVPAVFGPEITATVTFPEPGTWYVFGQAARGDKLLNTRSTIEVR
jgi:hypothetical protein